jgi:hypothetical protein
MQARFGALSFLKRTRFLLRASGLQVQQMSYLKSTLNVKRTTPRIGLPVLGKKERTQIV